MTRRSRVLALVATLGVGLAVGAAGVRVISAGPSPSAEGRGGAEPEGSGDRDGVAADEHPVATVRSEAGARSAAIAYATASQRWLYMEDAEIEAAVEAISTAGAARRLAHEVVGEVATAREALAASPGRVWWLVRPLATRVDHYDDSGARVSVWTVTILSAADVALPQADWLTVTVDLEWDGGGWRVAAVDDEAGPTPMVGVRDRPWQAQPFDEALDGFERVGEEAP